MRPIKANAFGIAPHDDVEGNVVRENRPFISTTRPTVILSPDAFFGTKDRHLFFAGKARNAGSFGPKKASGLRMTASEQEC